MKRSHDDGATGASAHLSPDERALASVPLVEEIVAGFTERSDWPIAPEQLLSAGLVAVLDAAREFDAARDGRFEPYASARIRSVLMAEIRLGRRLDPRETPAEPTELDEQLAIIHQRITEFEELERAGGDQPEVAAQLVRLRAHALWLVREAMRTREAATTLSPEQDAALRAAYAAVRSRRSVVGGPATPQRGTAPRPLRREA